MPRDSVPFQLIQANNAQRAFVARRLAALGLHVGQEQLLMRLWEEDGVSQSDLLAQIGCAAPTLTKAVQRLERVGLIRRERGGQPRVSRVFVTDEGWRLRADVESVWRTTEQRLLDVMSEQEQAQLLDVLTRITRAFEDDPHAAAGLRGDLRTA